MTDARGRRLRVVVLDYDGGDRTLATLAAVFADGWDGEREVVLVDNASTTPVVDEARRRFPDLVVMQADRNLGFAGGCNLGIGDPREVDLVALVNNDCTVTPGWLAPLVAALDAGARVGAAMPKVLLDGAFVRVDLSTDASDGVRVHEVSVDGTDRPVRLASGWLGVQGVTRRSPGFERTGASAVLFAPLRNDGGDTGASTLRLVVSARRAARLRVNDVDVDVDRSPRTVTVELCGPPVDLVNSAGVVVTDDGRGADIGWLEPDDGRWDAPGDVPAWTGAAVLLRSEYLTDVGLFDPALFLYSEDLELSWRGARRDWRYVCEPSSVVRHLHSATAIEGSRLATYYIERNRLLVLSRHAPARFALRNAGHTALVLLSYARRDLVVNPLHREPFSVAATKVRLGAYAGFLRRLPATLRQRRADRSRLGAPTLL